MVNWMELSGSLCVGLFKIVLYLRVIYGVGCTMHVSGGLSLI